MHSWFLITPNNKRYFSTPLQIHTPLPFSKNYIFLWAFLFVQSSISFLWKYCFSTFLKKLFTNIPDGNTKDIATSWIWWIIFIVINNNCFCLFSLWICMHVVEWLPLLCRLCGCYVLTLDFIALNDFVDLFFLFYNI